MPTRSAVIFAGTSTGARFALNLPGPVDQVWLLKDVRLTNLGGVSSIVILSVVRMTTRVELLHDQLAAAASATLSPWLVLEDGDFLQWYADAPDISMWLSGSKLLLLT